MSASSKSPFTMVGAQDAAVCVDGVCEVPPTQPVEGAPGELNPRA